MPTAVASKPRTTAGTLVHVDPRTLVQHPGNCAPITVTWPSWRPASRPTASSRP